MDVPALAPDETFARLIWDPQDVKDGVYQSSVIATKDLMGRERGWSVNRTQLLQRNYVEALDASRKCRKPDLGTPLLAAITFPDILAVVELDTSQPALDAKPNPTQAIPDLNLPENPAHALVFSRIQRGDAAAKRLKKQLLDKLQTAKNLDQFFQPPADPA